jgi:hypothetical protein
LPLVYIVGDWLVARAFRLDQQVDVSEPLVSVLLNVGVDVEPILVHQSVGPGAARSDQVFLALRHPLLLMIGRLSPNSQVSQSRPSRLNPHDH